MEFADLGIHPERTNSKLSAEACRIALKRANLKRVDAIIHSSCTPDYPVPSTASLVQDELGINDCSVYDIRSACCGSTQAISLARSLLLSETHSTILVVGMDVGSVFGVLDSNSKGFTKSDMVNACMIGDGGGCIIIKSFKFSNDNERTHTLSKFTNGILRVDAVINKSIGVGKSPGMYLPGGGSINPCNQRTLDLGLNKFKHEFKSVLNHGPILYLNAIHEMEKFSGISLSNIDILIPHQANGRLIELAEGLGLNPSIIYTNFERVGNTANGSLYICLDEIINQNRATIPHNGYILLISAESTKWLFGGVLLRYFNFHKQCNCIYSNDLEKEKNSEICSKCGNLKTNATLMHRSLSFVTKYKIQFRFFIIRTYFQIRELFYSSTNNIFRNLPLIGRLFS